jgi:hypothetical protein
VVEQGASGTSDRTAGSAPEPADDAAPAPPTETASAPPEAVTETAAAPPDTPAPPTADAPAETESAPSEPRRRRSIAVLAVDAAVLFGLAGVAITQPLLELLGSNPTFFVAGHYEPGQIVLFAVLVAVVPAAVVFVVSALPGLASRRLAPVAHGVGVAALAALFGLVLCRTLRIDGLVYVVPAVLLLGVGVALAEWRSRLARQFLAYLAVGNLAFVVLFVTSSPTSDLIGADDVAGQQGQVTVPELAGPVVVVVLDEFPVTAIMRGDGTLNDERYPHLARLAGTSTWFRNAASESPTTYISTPSILTGNQAEGDDLPVLDEHPRNLFSLFGDRHTINRYELVTDMCPRDACEPPPAEPLSQLLDDASVVYRHRVLPPDLRDGLPPVDAGWGDFGDVVDDQGEATAAPVSPSTTVDPDPMARAQDIADDELRPRGQLEVLHRQFALIDDTPSVNFVHVVLPHHPYLLTPWGEGYLPATLLPDEIATGANKLPPPDDPAYDFMFRQVYAQQAMQIGAVDSLLGEMIDHLEAEGVWEDALVVVTSDHGIDTSPPGFTRREDATNTDELFRIPLFVKAPGQTEAVVDDAPASTVDVLPSIIDLLDIETDWEMEGHSLYDGSEPTIERHVQTEVDAAVLVAAAHAARFPRGDDWVGLAAVGEAADLVGRSVDELRVGEPSALRWSLDVDDDVLDDLSVAHDNVPYVLEGTVSGSPARPPELLVAVNDTVAGTIGGYLPDDRSWRFTGHLAPFFEDGRNEVVAYEVERTGGTVTLHPLVT